MLVMSAREKESKWVQKYLSIIVEHSVWDDNSSLFHVSTHVQQFEERENICSFGIVRVKHVLPF